MNAMPERLEFRYRPHKQLLLMILGCLLAAGSWFLVRTPDDMVDRVMGWFGVGFFSLCAIVAAKRMIVGGVPFVFERSGIAFQTGNLGLISWREIESYAVITLRGNRLLALTFSDPDHVLSRVSAAKRRWAFANKGLGWGHWPLSFSGLTPGIDEAVAFIREQTSLQPPSP